MAGTQRDRDDSGAVSHRERDSEGARPNALESWSELTGEIAGRRPAVFLDYDGTLTPIAERPEQATLSDEMRGTLRRLASVWPTTIVSGRGRADVADLVALEELNYAGSHGFDIAGPEADGVRLEVDPELAPVVASAVEELRERIEEIPGVLVEDKTYSAAVHYRQVEASRVAEVERAVDSVLAERPRLKKSSGKQVFELRPSMDWDKGRAVLWLLEALELEVAEFVPLYVGDDVTDEDAFQALSEGRGIGVVVTDRPRATAARYSVHDTGEVRRLLERLTELRVGDRS